MPNSDFRLPSGCDDQSRCTQSVFSDILTKVGTWDIIQNMLKDMLTALESSTMADIQESIDERLVSLLKALSDSRRLSIFNMLMDGVQCNCEIAERLDVSLSLISYHLRILSEVGLVDSERDPDDGRWIYYSVNTQALAELRRAMAALLDEGRLRPRQPSCGPKACDRC
jgi:ArsR family transcriptional regulator, arsenate/arsenite/antimonite-responsive transcriptional repressor